MVCIYCGSKTRVTNSRSKSLHVWRRRECFNCLSIFTTRERPDLDLSFRVIKAKEGALQPFYRMKLFLSIYKSLSHKNTAITEAEDIMETVISHLTSISKRGLVKEELIAKQTLLTLEKFDKPAATYYKAHLKISLS